MPDNDQTNRIDLSRRKILGSLGAIGVAGAGAGFGTTAFFSDQEQFANNQLVAGELDLKVGWEEHYSDWSEDEAEHAHMEDGELVIDDREGYMEATLQEQFPDKETKKQLDEGTADPCDVLGDMPDDLSRPLIELTDVKPGDFGEVTFDFALCDNPGFLWLTGGLVDADENGTTEPEAEDADELDPSESDPANLFDNEGDESNEPNTDPDDTTQERVELLDALQITIWHDDNCDNINDDAEEEIFSGSLREGLVRLSGEVGLPIDSPSVEKNLDPSTDGPATGGVGSNRGCFEPETRHCVGFKWELPVDHANELQTDSVIFDLGFYTEQCRHNDGSPIDRPTGGVQPLTFEVTEGYGTLGGGPVDLQSDVGFPENMVTDVDTSGDPVEFVLDVPEDLDKPAGDQWSLVFDADNDGTVDFRVVFDEFFYQEWDDKKDEWGQEQQVPPDIETDIIDGIYLVRVPRDRLSDPFAFAGRLCYRESVAVSDFDVSTEPDDIVVPAEELCISLTGTTDPRLKLGPGTSGYEHVTFGPDLNCVIEKEVSVIQICYDFDKCRLLSNEKAKSCYKNNIIEAINAKLIKGTTPHNALTPAEIARIESLYDEGTSDSGGTVGLTIPLLLRRVQKVTETTITVKFLLCIVILVPCHDPLEGNLPPEQKIECKGKCKFQGKENEKDQQRQNAENEWGNGSWEENLHNHEKGHALASCLVCKILACLVDQTGAGQRPNKSNLIHPLWDPTNRNSPLVQANSMYHTNLDNGQDPEPAAKAAAWDTFDAGALPCLQSVFNAPNRGRAIQSTTECADDIPDFR